MDGKSAPGLEDKKKTTPLIGLRDSDLKPAFRALQTAYIRLLQNPFYKADDTTPIARTTMFTSGNFKTANRHFIDEVSRI
ncbi:hypothetical protein FQN51_000598, partial [Onygenales sp. PD_10]